MDKPIEAAVAWLCDSDIRNADDQKPSFGGINNAYIYDDRTYQYVYNEITGYAINTFLAMHRWLEKKECLQYAKDAADYLIRQQDKIDGQPTYHAIPHGLTHPGLKKVPNYYTFDNAIILHGMMKLYHATGIQDYLNAGLTIGKWLLSMQGADGSFYAHYELEGNRLKHPYDEFYFDHGCLHVKNAIGLMHLGKLADETEYVDAGNRVCDWGRQLLADDGLFWANTNRKYVFTHAHCYATEGYLHAYHLSQNRAHLDIARKAGDALIRLQNPDGSLYRIYKNKWSMKRWIDDRYQMSFKRWRGERRYPWKTIDATAQAARIWLLLHTIEKDDGYLSAAGRALAFVSGNQVLDTTDSNMAGGFYYQLCDTLNHGKPTVSRGMYTWCTQFGLSAILMAQAVREGHGFERIIELLY